MRRGPAFFLISIQPEVKGTAGIRFEMPHAKAILLLERRESA
jgi:hypothetical protein